MLKKVICCSVLSFILGNASCMNLDPMKGDTQNTCFSDVKDLQDKFFGKKQAAYQELFEDLAPTLAIMRMFLKDDFKPLTGDEASIKNNLRDNVKAFFGSDRFTPYGGSRQEIILDEELTDILCNMIEREQKESLKGNVTLYHGMTGSNLFVYKYFARLFSHLTGQDLGEFILRGDHLYAINPKTGKLFKTLQELKSSYEFKNDYDRGLDVSALQCNIALSVGPGTSLSTASSVELFCNSYSVTDYGVSRLITPALVLQGISIADARESAAKAEGLFNKYFSDLGGSLLTISLPIKEANRLAKHIWMGGKEYDPVMYAGLFSIYNEFFKDSPDYEKRNKLEKLEEIIGSINANTSISEIVEKIRDAYLWIDEEQKEPLAARLKDFGALPKAGNTSSISYLLENLKNSSNKDLSKDDVCSLTNEISLYLHPKMKAEIFGTFHHPLPKEDMKLLDAEIDKLAASHSELIINSKNKPVEGSFVIPRKVVPNKFTSYQIDLLPIFIGRGLLSDAKQIIDQHPNFLENVEIARLVLSSTLKALYDGYDEVLEFIETNCGINKLLSKIPEDELYPFLHMCARKNTDVAIGKLLKSLDNTGLDDRVFADLLLAFFDNSCSAPDLSLDSVLGEKELSQGVMRAIFSRMGFMRERPDGAVELFLNKGFSFNPNEEKGKEHLEELLKIRNEKSPWSLNTVIQRILDFYGLNREEYPELSEFLNDSGYEYNYEEGEKLRSYLESDEVDKDDKKSRIRQLSPMDQFYEVMGWLDYGDKSQQSLFEELSKEIKYPGTSMTIFDAREMYKKYIL